MKKKIGLVGYLGYAVDNPIIGGQLSKTRGIYNQLIKKYGEENIVSIDTSNWRKEKFKLLSAFWNMARTCDVIIMMPNKNGIKLILPLFSTLKKLYNYKIAYPVVGGWLTGLLKQHSYLKQKIKNVDYILPETLALAKELEEFVECKIEIMTIFSTRLPVDYVIPMREHTRVKKFCTFSRVIPEKGVDEAIEAISRVNESKKVCHLDVWGPIDEEFFDHYDALFQSQKDNVTYKGVLSGDEDLNTLAEYYMMLFPTFYYGEGFPTSVCESFMAGLPVIASDWRFNNELIRDGDTGYLVPVHDVDELTRRIQYAINNEAVINSMKEKTLQYSHNFLPDRVMKNLYVWIDEMRGK